MTARTVRPTRRQIAASLAFYAGDPIPAPAAPAAPRQPSARPSTAERLLQLKAGDALALSGRLMPKVYAKDGAEPRVSLDLVADEVAAVRRKPRQRAETESEV